MRRIVITYQCYKHICLAQVLLISWMFFIKKVIPYVTPLTIVL